MRQLGRHEAQPFLVGFRCGFTCGFACGFACGFRCGFGAGLQTLTFLVLHWRTVFLPFFTFAHTLLRFSLHTRAAVGLGCGAVTLVGGLCGDFEAVGLTGGIVDLAGVRVGLTVLCVGGGRVGAAGFAVGGGTVVECGAGVTVGVGAGFTATVTVGLGVGTGTGAGTGLGVGTGTGIGVGTTVGGGGGGGGGGDGGGGLGGSADTGRSSRTTPATLSQTVCRCGETQGLYTAH